jgi:hypothetical protein
MNRVTSCLCLILYAVIGLWGSTAVATCPVPDHDIHLGESICITVCWQNYTPVGVITPYPFDDDHPYPPEFVILPGCDPENTPCDDTTDCDPPCEAWWMFVDTVLFWGHNYGSDSAYWALLVGNNFFCPDDTFCVCVTFERQLPVELTAFSATAGDREVRLSWTTASETDNDHWVVERSLAATGPWSVVHEEPGQGTVSTETRYTYVDRGVQNGLTYWYRLTDVSLMGARRSHAPIDATPGGVSDIVPSEFVLKQNFPNPFNPTTTFEFAIPRQGFVTLKVYDLLGREVANVLEGNLEARQYQVTWKATNLSSGVYLYTLTAPGFSDTRKLLLMK